MPRNPPRALSPTGRNDRTLLFLGLIRPRLFTFIGDRLLNPASVTFDASSRISPGNNLSALHEMDDVFLSRLFDGLSHGEDDFEFGRCSRDLDFVPLGMVFDELRFSGFR